MAHKLKPDEIKWIVNMDAKGVQSELYKLSTKTEEYEAENKKLEASLKVAEKQLASVQKRMEKLRDQGKENESQYTKLRAKHDELVNSTSNYNKSLDINNKLISENNTKINQIISTMRIEDMTMEQLKKRAKELQIQLDKTSEAADPEAYTLLDKELTKVNSRMGELKNGSQSAFSVFKGGLAVLGGNLMTQAVGKIKEWIGTAKEWISTGIDMAKGAEGQIKYFNSLSNGTRVMKELKKATSGTISELKLMEKTIRAKELGIPIENMANLMDYARRQAQVLRKDVDFMADSLVDGLGRKSSLILDNLGISATRVQAEVKKTGDFTQAVLKIVNEELEKQGEYSLTAADKAAQSAAKWENAQLKVGQKFQWLGEAWDEMKGKIADGISDLIGDTRSLAQQYSDQTEKVADLELNTKTMAERYDELKVKSELTKKEQAELNRIMNSIANTIPGVITEFDKYGNILSINTGKVYEYIEAEKARRQFVHKDAIAELKKQREKLQKEYDTEEYISQNGRTVFTGGGMFGGGTTSVDKSAETMQKAADKVQDIGKDLQGLDAELARLTGTTMDEQLTAQKKMMTSRQQFREMEKKDLKAWIADTKNANDEYLALAQQTYDERFGTNPEGGGSKGSDSKSNKVLQQQRKELNRTNETLETKHQERLAKIREDYISGEIKSQADRDRKIYAEEQAFYILREEALKNFTSNQYKEEIRDDAGKQIATMQNQRLQQQIKYREQLEKILLDANPLEKERREYEERLHTVGLYDAATLREKGEWGEELELLTLEQQKALELLEKQHQDNLEQIRKNEDNRVKAQSEKDFEESFGSRREELQLELNQLMQRNAAMGKTSFNTEMDMHVKRLQMIQEEIDARNAAGVSTEKQIEQLGRVETQMTSTVQKELQKRTSQFQQYGNTIGTALGQVISGQEDALAAFGDATIDIVFDVVSQIIEAELIKVMASSTSAIMRATAEAMATPQSALTFGASGFATAAILTGAITAATVAAKAALKGLLGKKKGSSDTSSSDSPSTGSITVKQRARGKYDVVGADDGRTYRNVPYTGPAQTGMVYKPTLVGERGPELVISAPDMQSLQKHINYPLIVEAIRDARSGRVPQRARGKYDSLDYTGSVPAASPGIDPALIAKLTRVLDSMQKKGIPAIVGITDYQAELNKYNSDNDLFTRKN